MKSITPNCRVRTLIFSMMSITLSISPIRLLANETQSINVCQLITKKDYHKEITESFNTACKNSSDYTLKTLISNIENSYEKTKESRLLYWKSYAEYYQSLFYLHEKKEKQAKETVMKGIETMESLKNKDVEDYALLSMLHGFSCHFMGFPKVIKAARHSSNHLDKAIELDKENLRVIYVQAFMDFHRPPQFGGGKKVEELIKRALSLPLQTTTDGPSWGRQECFELISKFYIKKEKYKEAEKYILEGLTEYPNSSILQENRKKIEKH